MRKGIRSAIILPDMQVPYEDKKTLTAVENFMGNHKFDYYINLGDFLDLDCISKYSRGLAEKINDKYLAKDFAAGNAILDRHQDIIRKNNKNAKFVLLEGNHEYRAEKWIHEFPQFRGFLDVGINLNLKDRGFEYVRCYRDGDLYRLGNAYFTHGLYTSKYHAEKMANNFGVSIYYGHTHDVQSHSKVFHGKDKTVEGHSLGCLCDYEQGYIKGNPTNWQQAFGVGYFFPDGRYNIYTVRIFSHKFIGPDGKEYS